ncbi:MAG: Ku protein [Bacillota bacterium]|nr:Ku protein [Bacillota bacterium]
MSDVRSIWKGTLAFGLVNIPVRLYAAVEERSIRFRQLHRPCSTPVRYRKTCPTCGVEVPPEELARAYEVAPGRFVEVTDEDLEGLPLPTRHTVELLDFVEAGAVDPVAFLRGYYLEPDGGAKAYALLREALRRSGRAGVARLGLREKERLALLRVAADGRTLALQTLLYPDEVRSPAELAIPGEVEVDPREREMALRLVEMLSAPFDPGRYHDRSREALEALIARKAQGEPLRAPAPERPTGVEELTRALEESLRAAESRRDGRAAEPAGVR